MKPGDLVELCDAFCKDRAYKICVASEDGDDTVSNRYIPTGTLAVYLKKKRGAPDPAVVILIDGQLCWVWKNEIRPATGATAADP